MRAMVIGMLAAAASCLVACGELDGKSAQLEEEEVGTASDAIVCHGSVMFAGSCMTVARASAIATAAGDTLLSWDTCRDGTGAKQEKCAVLTVYKDGSTMRRYQLLDTTCSSQSATLNPCYGGYRPEWRVSRVETSRYAARVVDRGAVDTLHLATMSGWKKQATVKTSEYSLGGGSGTATSAIAYEVYDGTGTLLASGTDGFQLNASGASVAERCAARKDLLVATGALAGTAVGTVVGNLVDGSVSLNIGPFGLTKDISVGGDMEELIDDSVAIAGAAYYLACIENPDAFLGTTSETAPGNLTPGEPVGGDGNLSGPGQGMPCGFSTSPIEYYSYDSQQGCCRGTYQEAFECVGTMVEAECVATSCTGGTIYTDCSADIDQEGCGSLDHEPPF